MTSENAMAYLKQLGASDSVIVGLADKDVNYLVARNGIIVSAERTVAAQAALLRTARGWVVLDYTGHGTLVNGLRVADCKRVREGDEIQVGSLSMRLFEIRRERLSAESPLLAAGPARVECYVDYTPFQADDEVVYCPVCDSPHHAECWDFNHQRCAAGCGYRMPQPVGDRTGAP